MIRQRVNRHGIISPLEPEEELAACNIPRGEIGVIKEGPVRKWMTAKKQWDNKFASSKRKVQKQRAKEMAKGYYVFGNGEVPPPSALAGRRIGNEVKEKKKKKSMGMSLWALWGSKHDEKTTVREQKADKEPDVTVASPADGANSRPLNDTKTTQGKQMDTPREAYSRSRSRRRTVTDERQTEGYVNEDTPAFVLYNKLAERRGDPRDGNLTPDFAATPTTPAILVRSPTIEKDESELKRPKAGGIAFPFSLKQDADTASMMTLTSDGGVQPAEDLMAKESRNSGVGETVNGERPPLETFVTAQENLPTVS
jgi:hypothetical protein